MIERERKALNEILKLHEPTEGVDEKDNVIAICSLCGMEEAHETGEPRAHRFPCRTFTIVHKLLNPQIAIADVAKDALHKVKSTGGWDQNAPKVSKPDLKAVN